MSANCPRRELRRLFSDVVKLGLGKHLNMAVTLILSNVVTFSTEGQTGSCFNSVILSSVANSQNVPMDVPLCSKKRHIAWVNQTKSDTVISIWY